MSVSGPARKLPAIDEFLLTMMNLRLGLLEHDLADRFGISQTTVSRILNSWIPMMARKFQQFIGMPKTEKVL